MMQDATTACLRRAWRDSGMGLGQIACRAEVSERTVWAVMRGQNVRTASLFAICRALGVSVIPLEQTATSCETAHP